MRRIPALLAPLAAALVLAGADCQGGRTEAARVPVAGGDADRGKAVIRDVGCGRCHVIPGVDDADGTVGPPLTSWARRSYIAGHLANTPSNLVRWVTDPPAVEPSTAMPDLGLSDGEARDVAAYLYRLR